MSSSPRDKHCEAAHRQTGSITRRRFIGSGLVGAAACVVPVGAAAVNPTAASVGELLRQRVLPDGMTGVQARAFAARRVPSMPDTTEPSEWEAHAARIRREMFDRVIFTGEARRWRETRGRVEWSGVIEEDGYRIRKVRYEVLPGYWMPGLLYEPRNLRGRVPLVYCTQGHVGSGGGMSRPTMQARCVNLVRRGMITFISDWPDTGQLLSPERHHRMQQLDLCGTSGVAPFYLNLERALDFLLEHPHVDPSRVCVNGSSGGGWQTIFFAALDQRVTLANPVAGYSSLLTRTQYDTDLGDGEQQCCDMGTVADYTHLTAMMAPRPLLITLNASDSCCFKTRHALPPLLRAAEPVYDLYRAGHCLRAHNNLVVDPEPIGHNFGRENREALYRFLAEHFQEDDPLFPRQELPDTDAEMRSIEELNVELPADNLNFNRIARQLMENLPRQPEIPRDVAGLDHWRRSRRELLREIVRYREYAALDHPIGERHGPAGTRAIYRRFSVGEAWDVPAIELVPERPRASAVLMADGGRGELAAMAASLLASGTRVVAMDPFYFGEAALGHRDYLVALLLSCVGERPLGIQAAQTAAVCRFLSEREGQPVRLIAFGERTSTIATITAAIETNAVEAIELQGALDSFKRLIVRDTTVNKCPEAFCFGLLEHFDVPQLHALIAPRHVRLITSADLK
ncbi:MAG: acetylxylan esterase [Opitutaceae bacterium]|nr:acetylxylan esterase [Opitutaceae bacterium]